MLIYKNDKSIVLRADPHTNKYLRFTNIPNSEELFGKIEAISVFTTEDIDYIEEVEDDTEIVEEVTNGESE